MAVASGQQWRWPTLCELVGVQQLLCELATDQETWPIAAAGYANALTLSVGKWSVGSAGTEPPTISNNFYVPLAVPVSAS